MMKQKNLRQFVPPSDGHIPNWPGPGKLSADFKNVRPRTEGALTSLLTSDWKFTTLFLWPSRSVERGAAEHVGAVAQVCWLNVRTKDDKIDTDAISKITKQLSLKGKLGASIILRSPPLSEGNTFSFSAKEDDALCGEISLVTREEGNHYSITVLKPRFLSFSPMTAQQRVQEIAKKLFELKEKPHFHDVESNSFGYELYL